MHLSLQITIFILGTTLLSSLKSKVVELASNANVLETIQRSAQGCLQVGWMVLLPTAEERARALSALLPNSVPANPDSSGTLPNVPNGKRFMTDLLVSSLMADGGLEIALLAAIKIEVSGCQFDDYIFQSGLNFCKFKGQLISKRNGQAEDSPKKRTNEFVFTSMRRVFVRFLGESSARKKSFRDYLTFTH